MSYCAVDKYWVIDLETTTRESYGRKANPFDKDNRIVAIGLKLEEQEAIVNHEIDNWTERTTPFYCPYPKGTLVGFNIKFDLLYIWDQKICTNLHKCFEAGMKIWDCQLVEYILSGQTHTYPSLDQCALKYGGTLKDDRIKALWKSGCQTQDIPKDMLLEYLKHDVLNTELVYLSQLEEVNRLKLDKFIELQMDALLCTIEMEYNGMYVDRDIAAYNKAILSRKLQKKEEHIQSLMQYGVPINIASNNDMSAIFFGGQVKVTNREQIGVFKSGSKIGEPRYKVQTDVVTINGLTKPHANWVTARPGVYSVNEAVLTALTKRKRETDAKDLAILLLEYRGLAKELNTYYESMVQLTQLDGCIHHSLNHCATATGRLSSTKPNMQNIPKTSDSECNVKNIFTSRFPGGSILELDFKSLEVVAAAFLSQDPVMIQDLVSGADPHIANAATVFDKPIDKVTDEERQIAKVASFQLLYGAGQNKIGEVMFNGDVEKAKLFINAYYSRYSRLYEWQQDTIKTVKSCRRISTQRTECGLPSGESILYSITGRMFKFYEYDAPAFLKKKGISTSFSPTEIKNYPVQGFATADMVLFQLGTLFRVLSKHTDKCLLINTVHDSVLIDCRKEYLQLVSNTAKIVLEDVPTTLRELGIDFNVPIEVSTKSGESWGSIE